MRNFGSLVLDNFRNRSRDGGLPEDDLKELRLHGKRDERSDHEFSEKDEAVKKAAYITKPFKYIVSRTLIH